MMCCHSEHRETGKPGLTYPDMEGHDQPSQCVSGFGLHVHLFGEAGRKVHLRVSMIRDGLRVLAQHDSTSDPTFSGRASMAAFANFSSSRKEPRKYKCAIRNHSLSKPWCVANDESAHCQQQSILDLSQGFQPRWSMHCCDAHHR